ncbi:MAG: hypothetical protein ACRD8W_25175 [Nitrososphaeraceae archaeon]
MGKDMQYWKLWFKPKTIAFCKSLIAAIRRVNLPGIRDEYRNRDDTLIILITS